MLKLTPTGRFAVYAGLGLGTILFAFPLVWMILTSLKPIEQTMVFPPKWLPMAYTVVWDNQPVEVTLDERIEVPSVLVEQTAGQRAGQRTLVTVQRYDPNDPNFQLIRKAEPGWWLVSERSDSITLKAELRRDVVPEEAIRSQFKFRWNNYPKALATMGGRQLAEVEGTLKSGAAEAKPVGFGTFLLNTVIVCVFGVLGSVLSNALIAYGFARVRWRGRDVFFGLTLATMMIPFPVLMVPLYGVFKSLGWIGTLYPLWVPSFFGSAFNIFLMRQFFRTIPEELSEAARIDGCSEWRIFWRIILPLSRPVLAVVALFHFLYAWNDFLGPLLYLTRKETFTLALALQNYQTQHGGVQWNHLMAASALTVIPIIILFFFAQKTFIQGIATTGTKG
ncbi:MAG: carbohydrate ABC transporter permease [Opitutaceae bacterium]